MVVTVDGGAPTNWETFLRLRRTDTRQCDSCHGKGAQDFVAPRPNYAGIDVSDPASLNIATVTWDWIKRLRKTIKMKIVLKGILTRKDAKLAADNGMDGIIVSNHGGRVVDSGRATIEVLPEVIERVLEILRQETRAAMRRPADRRRRGPKDRAVRCTPLARPGPRP